MESIRNIKNSLELDKMEFISYNRVFVKLKRKSFLQTLKKT